MTDKTKKDYAPGLPDKEYFGDINDLNVGEITDVVAQLHDAEKAGEHLDWRMLADKDLLSWAIPKARLPEPNEKALAVRQPAHRPDYMDFEGTIDKGYGKGTVSKYKQDRALITDINNGGLTFSLVGKNPEKFRLQKTDKNWILYNVTPNVPHGYNKQKFKTVDQEDVEEIISPDNLVAAKLDGSSQIVRILDDKLQSLSYRVSKKTGRPIVHTERAGLSKLPNKDLSGTDLRAELYVTKDGKGQSAATTSGILNSSVEKALQKQKEQGYKLRHGVFDVLKYKGKDVSDLPYEKRRELAEKVVQRLQESKSNQEIFHMIRAVDTPEEQRKLFKQIREGKYPLTEEGIVAYPKSGDRPYKVKNIKEHDIIIKEVVPGEGKFSDSAGTFKYALPENPDKIVGNVGIGELTHEQRKEILENKEEYIDRVARVKAQEQFPSGAYRVPSLIAFHDSV